APACEHKAPVAASNLGERRACIAGQLVTDLITNRTGALVEGDHAAILSTHPIELTRWRIARVLGCSADLADQQILVDHWCAADTEKVLHDTELLGGIEFPQ